MNHCQEKAFLIIALLSCVLLFGCNRQENLNPDAPLFPEQLEKTNNPLSVSLFISAKEISVAESLQLTLTATAPEGYHVFFPEFKQSLGDFTLLQALSTPKKLGDSGIVTSRTWTLSPYLPGTYSLPQLNVTAKQDKGASTEELKISLPAQTITVTSFLEKEDENPKISDIYPPVSLAVPFSYYLIGGCGALLLITFFAWLIFRHKKNEAPPPQTPLHILALEKISHLMDKRSPETTYSQFYGELSLILRHYIEQGFGLKAAEQTTEEFVVSLGSSSLFSVKEKDLLKNFLHRSDMIKFARMIPAESEVSQSVEVCRAFITATGEKMEYEKSLGSDGGVK